MYGARRAVFPPGRLGGAAAPRRQSRPPACLPASPLSARQVALRWPGARWPRPSARPPGRAAGGGGGGRWRRSSPSADRRWERGRTRAGREKLRLPACLPASLLSSAEEGTRRRRTGGQAAFLRPFPPPPGSAHLSQVASLAPRQEITHVTVGGRLLRGGALCPPESHVVRMLRGVGGGAGAGSGVNGWEASPPRRPTLQGCCRRLKLWR